MIVPYGFVSRSLSRRLSNVPEGDSPAGGGETSGGAATDPPIEPKPGTVSREFAERLLSEKKAMQARADAAEADLKKYRDKESELELQRKKAAGDFESIEQKLKTDIAERDKKISEYDSMVKNVRRMQSFRRVLGADVPEKFRALVELDEIDLDADGNPVEASVTKYAANFRKQYGEIIGVKKALPPDDGANGNPDKKLTVEEWQKLPYAEQKKRMSEVVWTAKP